MRSVVDQASLVQLLRSSIKPQYALVVIDQSHIASSSYGSRTAWMDSAEMFIRAAAVIGPHGGAFGNIFLCSWNTTIIEFNLPWSKRAVDDSRSNTVRDLFHATARGIGNFNYWNVWPTSIGGLADGVGKVRPKNNRDYDYGNIDASVSSRFYFGKEMHVESDEVLEILVRAGIASRALRRS